MSPKVYIETTIVSYLTARPSRDLITAAHQQLTREWWENWRRDFSLFVSQAVIQESSAGDTEMSQSRLSVLETIPLLELNNETMILARRLVEDGPIPERAATDALQI